jgi:hypothetical protein
MVHFWAVQFGWLDPIHQAAKLLRSLEIHQCRQEGRHDSELCKQHHERPVKKLQNTVITSTMLKNVAFHELKCYDALRQSAPE